MATGPEGATGGHVACPGHIRACPIHAKMLHGAVQSFHSELPCGLN